MAKRGTGKRAAKRKTLNFRRPKVTVVTALVPCLMLAGAILAHVLSAKPATTAPQGQCSPCLPAASPSREYIHVGGRLAATEAPSGALEAPGPSNLVASAVSSSQINLTWTDNNTDEDGFKLERTVGPTGTYAQIATLPPNTTSYSDTGLIGSTSFYYRVKAYNAGTGDSPPSNEANAMTLPDDVLLADDFNDDSLDTAKWTAGDLFSSLTDATVPVNETAQQLQIGPLYQNTAGSHYNGIRSARTYDFIGAYCYAQLVQPAAPNTTAFTMFTMGYNIDNFYRIYVSAGNLYGEKKIGGTKTQLFTVAYDPANHKFLRIRHASATASVIFETAPDSGGIPGSWTQRHSETWDTAAVPLSTIQFELKAGTSDAEANAPGTVIFDNFRAARSDVTAPVISNVTTTNITPSGATIMWVTNEAADSQVEYGTTTAYGSSTPITDTEPLVTTHSVTLGSLQAGTLYNYRVKSRDQAGNLAVSGNFTFTTAGPPETVLLADDFNDHDLDTDKWSISLLSGTQDTTVPVDEANQKLLIGPLYQNTADSHYNGILSVNAYDFTGAYAHVELVEAPATDTTADAMFTVVYDYANHYRIFVEAGVLKFEKKLDGVKTTLGSVTFDAVNHAFWRIRHDPATDQILFETAPGSAGVPGTWTTRQTVTRELVITWMKMELKAGTWQAEANAPGTVAFDNFKLGRP